MSGHSKWSTIKRKKGAVDAKRGKIFTKLIRELSTAARIGGADVDSNPRLRLVVEKAKSANMPKDTMNRAIQKGAGNLEGEQYDEGVYEGYGPGGVAILLETLSDNKNRTASEVRHALTKNGGTLGSVGCVSYLFEKKGTLDFATAGLDVDALMEAALEAGAEDVVESDETVEVVTTPGEFEAVRSVLSERGYTAGDSGISMRPSTTVNLAGADAESMLKLMEALEDLDDVQNVYANFEISDDEISKFA